MRKILVCGVLLGGLAIALSSQSCKGESEPINSVCKSFCGELVNAMDDSDWYDLGFEGVSGTKKSCGQDCTEVVDEYKGLDRGDMGDCVECIADKGFNQIGGGDSDVAEKDDWTMGVIPADILGPDGDDCIKKCDRDDIEYSGEDGLLIGEFLNDFATDFAHHWSSAEPFCDGYGGDDLCCKESNPCFIIDNNGNCECGGDCYWDDYDCEGGTDIDTDVDGDTDSDADTDGCDDTALTTCSEDATSCMEGCADTDCTYDCMVEFCDCADIAGCAEEMAGTCDGY